MIANFPTFSTKFTIKVYFNECVSSGLVISCIVVLRLGEGGLSLGANQAISVYLLVHCPIGELWPER